MGGKNWAQVVANSQDLISVLGFGSDTGGTPITNTAQTGLVDLNATQVQISANVAEIDVKTANGHIDVLAGAGLQLLCDTSDLVLQNQLGGVVTLAANGDITLSTGNVLVTMDVAGGVDFNIVKVGFFGQPPVVQQHIPSVLPALSDVITALVNLGLCEQS